MMVPTAQTLLTVWEAQHAAHPLRRALALLDAAWPDVGQRAWAAAPVGERDAWLLTLYERLFGPDLRTLATCPQCGERLETDFRTADIRGARTPALPAPQTPRRLHCDGYTIEYRLPDSDDLLAVSTLRSDGVAALLARCVLSAAHDDTPCAAEELPPRATARLAEAMSRADPDADVRISLNCPACAHAWKTGFDIVTHLWLELEDWAQRTLAEVHALARAYGWGEGEILALSPTRRQLYLELVRA